MKRRDVILGLLVGRGRKVEAVAFSVVRREEPLSAVASVGPTQGRMREDTAVAGQGQAGVVELGRDQFDRIVDQRLADVLIVDLVVLRYAIGVATDSQFFLRRVTRE